MPTTPLPPEYEGIATHDGPLPPWHTDPDLERFRCEHGGSLGLCAGATCTELRQLFHLAKQARPPSARQHEVTHQYETCPPILSADVMTLIEANKGIFLDIGCSDHKSPGSVGMDIRAVEGVDIVHSLLDIPWPLPDACCKRILASHILEHLDPSKMVDIFNEMHRVMQPSGQLLIAMPYAGSPRFWQDPTHIHAWNEATCQYYDCAWPLWNVYRPQCWFVEVNYWDSVGDIHVVMSKRATEHGQYHTTNGMPIKEIG